MAVAVVGGGLLGSLTALLAASRGWEVELIDERPALLSAASAANEGKVHLGPIFALGDPSTHERMLRGALAFAPLIEEAVGEPIAWHELSTDAFDYLVMPSSLLDAAGLAVRYTTINAMFERLSSELGTRYLGRSIEHVVDPHHWEDPTTGMPGFSTSERAIDPLRLRGILLARLEATPTVTIRLSHSVERLEPAGGGVDVAWRSGSTSTTRRFDYAVNCTWESQLTLTPESVGREHNFRLKTAVRLPRVDGGRTVTLIQGPFGDVVTHRDYTYASWYPVARLTNEYGREPSLQTRRQLALITDQAHRDEAETRWLNSLGLAQVTALQSLGLLPDDVGHHELVGGMIVGHGARDIDQLESQLHSRAEFGALDYGGLVVPSNFKLTTAPLAASDAIEVIESSLARTVIA